MHVNFIKYHGAGNDFILIDNRKNSLSAITEKQIEMLCNRHFGIGADGLITLNKSKKASFEMIYYNADGRVGSMCGNGARCFVLFAHNLGLIKNETEFTAYDGLHRAIIKSVTGNSAIIKVSMSDVREIEEGNGFYLLNTGSPHYVTFVKGINTMNVVGDGMKIRYNNRFKKNGVNVNFIEAIDGVLKIRTYERGVENETLACGTGITASAIVAHHAGFINPNSKQVKLHALGGDLTVYFKKNKNGYKNIFLQGPAEMVFSGVIQV